MSYVDTWDLDVFFEGGSHSPQLREHLELTKQKIVEAQNEIESLNVPRSADAAEELVAYLHQMTDVSKHLRQVGAVIGCLLAADTTDQKALLLQGEMSRLSAAYQPVMLKFQQLLAQIEESVWAALIETEQLATYAFILNEWREEVALKLSGKEENLITALSVDGYEAWGNLYDQLVSTVQVEVEVDGEKQSLSVGQASNLSSHPDANVRKEAYEKLEEAWTEKEGLFASTLNHLAGFRLAMYEKRGWDSVLQEPLNYNRMKQETLDAMWGAINAQKAPFVQYLHAKAEGLGEERMHWYDLDAPVTNSTKTLSYDEGAAFILKHFGEFGEELEAFSRKAFEDRWIEAEDRANKRPGGFCTGMPMSEQSRIFMTYSGTMSNVATLAHELGHAFHSYALRPVPYLNRGYAMNVAETASTFAEMIVADAAVKSAETKEEKIALLEDKVQRSVAFFMNIQSRFLFETRFYEARKNGIVPAEKLNELMEEAQQEAYGGAIGIAHPHFWASKLHFYMTSVPFYNFPYTFGYLFSLSIYAKALEEGKNFEEKYIALLQDTAIMTVEELAMKHLGEDITKEEFWGKGVTLCVEDVKEFLTLTAKEG